MQLANDVAVYLRGLCRTMFRGVHQQLNADNLVKDGCFGIQVPDDDAEVHEDLYGRGQCETGQYVDDTTGQVPHEKLVQEARFDELTYFAAIGVWKKVSEGPWEHR